MCETTREERDAVLREAAEWLSIATATRASERLGVVCSCVRAKGAGVGWSVFGSVVCWAQPHAHACKHSVVHVGARLGDEITWNKIGLKIGLVKW